MIKSGIIRNLIHDCLVPKLQILFYVPKWGYQFSKHTATQFIYH